VVHPVEALADRREAVAELADDLDAARGALLALLRRRERAPRRVLDPLDQARDRPGGALRLLGELADLVGHDGEALALLARAGRLDRRVQREQVRLPCDAGDRLDD